MRMLEYVGQCYYRQYHLWYHNYPDAVHKLQWHNQHCNIG